MKRNWWIAAGVLFLLTYVLYTNFDKTNETSNQVSAQIADKIPKAGAQTPAFTLKGLDGETYEVGGNRDKPLLINFWASWCDPCKEEAPDLVKMSKKYEDKLDIYAVNVTYYDKMDKVEEFVKEYGLTFPVLLDTKEEVFRKYNGVAYPTNVLINRDGTIHDVMIGLFPAKHLEQKIKKLLKEN